MDEKDAKDINERLENIEGLMRVLVRQKVSNKSEKLMEEVKTRGRMNTNHVMEFLNTSRNHALNLMKKVAEFPGFVFRVGDKQRRSTSFLVFDENKVIRDQCVFIQDFLKTSDELPLMALINKFNTDVNDARLMAENFVNSYPEYDFQINKIARRKQ